MTGLSRFDFYPRDWISGTVGLSDRARGVYIDLLARMYDLGRPLDSDTRDLCRFLRYRDYRQLNPVLKELIEAGKIIVTGDGKLTNERFEKEIEAANRHIENSRKGGAAKAEKARKKVTKPVPEGDQRATSGRSQDPSFEQKQSLNPCPPSPSPSKKKEPSKKKGAKSAFWALAGEITTKSGRPEKQVRQVMGRFLNLHDGNFAGATVALETCLGKNDPFTYMTGIIEKLKASPPKQGGASFNGPYERTPEEAEYLASLDPCHLDPDEEAYLEELRRDQADG